MSKRLGGKLKTKVVFDPIYENQIHSLGSMEQAVTQFRKRFTLHGKKDWDSGVQDAVAGQMLNGTAALDGIMTRADELIDRAIEIDPRLVKRSSWVRAEEGIDACPVLLAAGDDRPCFDRRKTRLSDRATIECCRVVISTDSKEIKPENASAFIAAAKLSQQFRPLEIWWQGAWLIEEDRTDLGRPGVGQIFHVPLVQGELDFRRLEFVLSSNLRDSVSYSIMFSYAYPARQGWGGGVAEYSYLEGESEFVKESGIDPSPERVAAYAARWAGLEPSWSQHVSPWEAEQSWRPAESSEPYRSTETEAERKRRLAKWEREAKEREKATLRENKQRLANAEKEAQ